MKKLLLAALAIGFACAPMVFADQKNDDRIYDQVRIRLTGDPDVKGGIGLDVTVKDGVVTLKGRVDTEKAKNRATKLSKKVKGVKDVDNELTVGPSVQ
jgi:hyperosmotically inducible periplasmic protein